jgi:hypothetical protein
MHLTIYKLTLINKISKEPYIDKQQSPPTYREACSTQSRGRTGTTVKLLVFETNASTDSAIWAPVALNGGLIRSKSGRKCI